MFDKLDFILEKYEELAIKVSDPDIIANQSLWQKHIKEMSEMEPVVNKYREYKKVKDELAELKNILSDSDEELRNMAKSEIPGFEEKLEALETEMQILLLPKDPNDDKNVILEVRAGVGGDEAGLFAADLLRMYMRYAERRGWKCDLTEINEIGIGGVKEAVVIINGRGAYSRLKYESGTHRVQRVPSTESSGRVHTSAATVAVLPEVDDLEVMINPNDVRTDVYRSSGHGGQSVNTTDSAVRLTHIPTGIVVTCQDEKSQIKNKEKAMKVLKSRLYDMMQEEQNREIADTRKNQVGSGDRSQRIRTYNFQQGRITDHRINLTIYKLDTFLDGDIDEVIDACITNDQAEKMKNL